MSNNKVYSDMDYRLKMKQSGNVNVLLNEDCINQSIKMIFATINGERVRNAIGSSLIGLLFEPISSDTAREIRYLLKDNIETYEPRIEVIRINIRPLYDENVYDVRLHYRITQSPNVMSFTTRLRSLQEF